MRFGGLLKKPTPTKHVQQPRTTKDLGTKGPNNFRLFGIYCTILRDGPYMIEYTGIPVLKIQIPQTAHPEHRRGGGAAAHAAWKLTERGCAAPSWHARSRADWVHALVVLRPFLSLKIPLSTPPPPKKRKKKSKGQRTVANERAAPASRRGGRQWPFWQPGRGRFLAKVGPTCNRKDLPF